MLKSRLLKAEALYFTKKYFVYLSLLGCSLRVRGTSLYRHLITYLNFKFTITAWISFLEHPPCVTCLYLIVTCIRAWSRFAHTHDSPSRLGLLIDLHRCLELPRTLNKYLQWYFHVTHMQGLSNLRLHQSLSPYFKDLSLPQYEPISRASIHSSPTIHKYVHSQGSEILVKLDLCMHWNMFLVKSILRRDSSHPFI